MLDLTVIKAKLEADERNEPMYPTFGWPVVKSLVEEIERLRGAGPKTALGWGIGDRCWYHGHKNPRKGPTKARITHIHPSDPLGLTVGLTFEKGGSLWCREDQISAASTQETP